MTSLDIALYCVLVSVIWGATNPLIKKTTAGIVKVEADCRVKKFLNEIRYLIANWKYVLLFIINQLGSVLFFFLLQDLDLSLIIPTVDSLSFVITSIVGLLVGESAPSCRTFFGVILILAGTTLCVIDKCNAHSTGR